VGKEPRIIVVSTFPDPETRKGKGYFPHPLPGVGAQRQVQDRGLARNTAGRSAPPDRPQRRCAYEQSWMPEASILGEAAADRISPVTEATLEGDPQRGGPLLVLNAKDRGSPEEGIPPSGVGITYYWVNDSGVWI